MFYLVTIALAVMIITVANFLLGGVYTLLAFGSLLLTVLVGVATVFAIDGVLAFVVRRMPEAWFSSEAKAFSVGKREKNFYRRTRINIWKKYVPEWGCFTGFHKDKMRSVSDSEYIGRFILESNYGVLGHIAGAVFGFLIMLLPFLRPFSIALPIAVVNFILSVLPTMILRFNTPPLRRLYRRSLASEKSRSDEGAEDIDSAHA